MTDSRFSFVLLVFFAFFERLVKLFWLKIFYEKKRGTRFFFIRVKLEIMTENIKIIFSKNDDEFFEFLL